MNFVPFIFELDYVMYPEGSVLVSMGNHACASAMPLSKTICHPWLKYGKQKHGWVTAEYAMLPRSTEQRNQRETLQPKGRTQEIQRLIARSLRCAVDLDKLGERADIGRL